MLTYKYIHVQFYAKEKKKNTPKSKNEKKIAEE